LLWLLGSVCGDAAAAGTVTGIVTTRGEWLAAVLTLSSRVRLRVMLTRFEDLAPGARVSTDQGNHVLPVATPPEFWSGPVVPGDGLDSLRRAPGAVEPKPLLIARGLEIQPLGASAFGAVVDPVFDPGTSGPWVQ